MKHYVTVDPTDLDADSAEHIIGYWFEGEKTPGANDHMAGETRRKQGHLIFHTVNYKANRMYWNGTDIVRENPTLTKRRKRRKRRLKKEYITDAYWTDDSRIYYKKLVDSSRNTQSDDDWYVDIMIFWGEAWDERKQNKQDCNNAADQAALDAITYNPTHVKSREDLE